MDCSRCNSKLELVAIEKGRELKARYIPEDEPIDPLPEAYYSVENKELKIHRPPMFGKEIYHCGNCGLTLNVPTVR